MRGTLKRTYYNRIKTKLYNRKGALFALLEPHLTEQKEVRLPLFSEAGALELLKHLENEERKRDPEAAAP